MKKEEKITCKRISKRTKLLFRKKLVGYFSVMLAAMLCLNRMVIPVTAEEKRTATIYIVSITGNEITYYEMETEDAEETDAEETGAEETDAGETETEEAETEEAAETKETEGKSEEAENEATDDSQTTDAMSASSTAMGTSSEMQQMRGMRGGKPSSGEMPEGFDMQNMPGNRSSGESSENTGVKNMSDSADSGDAAAGTGGMPEMPEGFDAENMPSMEMPEGFDAENMPSMGLPEGFDAENMPSMELPEDFDMESMAEAVAGGELSGKFGMQKNTVTTYLPVAVVVHTDTGEEMTFNILKEGDELEVLIETDEDGNEVITEIWMKGEEGSSE